MRGVAGHTLDKINHTHTHSVILSSGVGLMKMNNSEKGRVSGKS